MDWLYKKVMSWAFGQAIAHSDRVKIAVYSGLVSAAAMLAPACPFCPSILTPDVLHAIAGGVVALGIKLIHSLDHRDIAGPDEVVLGEAMPELPPELEAQVLSGAPPK